MISVFEASSALEAHMVLNLLDQEGIKGRVDGEYLQGGIGELQTMGLVRVMVEEADLAQARSVIHEWESTQVATPPVQSQKSTSCLGAFALGAVLGGLVVYLFVHA